MSEYYDRLEGVREEFSDRFYNTRQQISKYEQKVNEERNRIPLSSRVIACIILLEVLGLIGILLASMLPPK